LDSQKTGSRLWVLASGGHRSLLERVALMLKTLCCRCLMWDARRHRSAKDVIAQVHGWPEVDLLSATATMSFALTDQMM